MTIKEALRGYFDRLTALYQKRLGTLPTVSWYQSLNQNLFTSLPDEDGEAQWRPADAAAVSVPGLCRELEEFFSSYYYWQLHGKADGVLYYFPPVVSAAEADKAARTALKEGEYYFAGQNTALLATCSQAGNDDLLLFYRQNFGELFLYDQDKRFLYPVEHSLVSLLDRMEAIL